MECSASRAMAGRASVRAGAVAGSAVLPQSKPKTSTTTNTLRGPNTLRSGLVVSNEQRFQNGNGMEEQLEVIELLGQGSYGLVHRMQEKKTGQCRVLKTVVRPTGWDDARLKLEAEILQNLDHPHILRIFSWYEDGDSINIVMEHCEGGELLQAVREGRKRGEALDEIWMAQALRQPFEALVYIHSKGVVHKDLKGQNLLLLHSTESAEGRVFGIMPHVVVCDLGIAEICTRGIFGLRGSKVAGTPATMAPEVWTGSCGPKSDVWSMGCVMFELFTNRLPFELLGTRADMNTAARNQAKWHELHKKGPRWELMRCSPPPLQLCQQLLFFKESLRPTATDCLKHSWFVDTYVSGITDQEVKSLVKAICTWQVRSGTQRAFCLKMASSCTCISKFARIFSKFDTDNSGILDKTELISALTSLGIDSKTAKKAAEALDVNNDNSCEYIEFAAACLLSLEDQYDELLRQEFRLLDANGDGDINEKELAPLINDLEKLAADRGLKLQQLDTDGDGSISFEEFCSFFGRPGIKYSNADVKGNLSGGRKGIIPMKQHVRIVGGGTGTIEQSMEVMRKSPLAASSELQRATSNDNQQPPKQKRKLPEKTEQAAKSAANKLMANAGGSSTPSNLAPVKEREPSKGSCSSSPSQSPSPSPATSRSPSRTSSMTPASSSPALPAAARLKVPPRKSTASASDAEADEQTPAVEIQLPGSAVRNSQQRPRPLSVGFAPRSHTEASEAPPSDHEADDEQKAETSNFRTPVQLLSGEMRSGSMTMSKDFANLSWASFHSSQSVQKSSLEVTEYACCTFSRCALSAVSTTESLPGRHRRSEGSKRAASKGNIHEPCATAPLAQGLRERQVSDELLTGILISL